MLSRAVILIALVSSVSMNQAYGGLLINEVMSNEPGGTTTLEWVELWNYSDSTMTLSGLSFDDAGSVTELGDTVTLTANSFALLARDAVRFEERWGDSSGVWGDSESEGYPLLACRMSLRNSHDTVAIVNESGDTITNCGWTSSSPDGVSLERTDPRDSESSAIWEDSRSSDGSTPGARNSVTPGYNDLELTAALTVEGAFSNQLAARLTIRNIGLAVSDSNELRMGVDLDGDTVLSEFELLYHATVEPINIYESVVVSKAFTMPTGIVRIAVSLMPDDDPSNNLLCETLRFGVQPFEVVINEILPDPESPLESEWIELYNTADTAIDLDGWTLCDSVGCAPVHSASIEGGDYLILCQDETAFRAFYQDVNVHIVALSGWRLLNNSGDHVFLTDEAGLILDSVYYSTGAGDNVSLERIDPHAVGYNSSNWYRSTASSGSTPGAANSVQQGFSPGFSIELASRIISPDGDGIDDILTIRYDLPRECALTLRVYDLNGNILRSIFEEVYLSSGEFEFDGCDDGGASLDIGMYVMYARVDGEIEAVRKLVFAVVGRR